MNLVAAPATTWTDAHGRTHSYLRISLTDRCNLRCAYCMPHEDMIFQPNEQLLTDAEILRLARIFTVGGVTKIRLTGGEPLIRPGVPKLIQQLSQLPNVQTLAMTTNATLLAGQTEALKAAGLQVLNISLDTLRPDRFATLTRRAALQDVLAGIDAALATVFEALKLNVVAMKGFNDDEIADFVALARHQPINVRFIEAMPFKDNHWETAQLLPYRTIMQRIETETPYRLRPLATEASAVGKDYALFYENQPCAGTVSFVTSMTDSFCGTCNRLRLTADGQLKACLFQPAEGNLRDALRSGASDADLQVLIQQALNLKQAAHEPLDDLIKNRDLNRPMIAIGG